MIEYKSINRSNATLDEREAYFSTLTVNIDEPQVLLQTCNRIEIYYGSGDVAPSTAQHLFRVACGLESALVGESAIQGQVRDAYQSAKLKYKLPAEMHKLFTTAIGVGKRVRNETQISHGAVSHSLATLEVIESEGIDIRGARIVIAGVNKLTVDILKFMKNKGARMVALANRSIEKARAVAEEVGIDVRPLSDKRTFLSETDILISATSAPHLIFNRDDFANRPMLAIDLAFPRDIDPRITEIPGVKLYNLTDVEAKVQHNISVRQGEIVKAESIINQAIIELNETLERRRIYRQCGKYAPN